MCLGNNTTTQPGRGHATSLSTINYPGTSHSSNRTAHWIGLSAWHAGARPEVIQNGLRNPTSNTRLLPWHPQGPPPGRPHTHRKGVFRTPPPSVHLRQHAQVRLKAHGASSQLQALQRRDHAAPPPLGPRPPCPTSRTWLTPPQHITPGATGPDGKRPMRRFGAAYPLGQPRANPQATCLKGNLMVLQHKTQNGKAHICCTGYGSS